MTCLCSTSKCRTTADEYLRCARCLRSRAAYDLYAKLANQVRGLFDREDSDDDSYASARRTVLHWRGRSRT